MVVGSILDYRLQDKAAVVSFGQWRSLKYCDSSEKKVVLEFFCPHKSVVRPQVDQFVLDLTLRVPD